MQPPADQVEVTFKLALSSPGFSEARCPDLQLPAWGSFPGGLRPASATEGWAQCPARALPLRLIWASTKGGNIRYWLCGRMCPGPESPPPHHGSPCHPHSLTTESPALEVPQLWGRPKHFCSATLLQSAFQSTKTCNFTQGQITSELQNRN